MSNKCGTCGYEIRGKNHKSGTHHGMEKPKITKQQIRLNRRIASFDAEKIRLERTPGGFHAQIHRPGSLQMGKVR